MKESENLVQTQKNDLILSKLVLKGFRSWKDEATFVFPIAGPILFTGYDTTNNTGSGTGKSSVLEAIAFALGYSSIPSTILKNWDSKSMSVELTLKDNLNEYVIIRAPKLKIIENGMIDKNETAAGFEVRLKEILGIPKDLVEALVYRPQRQAGRFIHFTDSKKKEFLTACLKLKEVETAYDQFNADLKTLSTNKEVAERELTFIQDQLNNSTADGQEMLKAKQQHLDAKHTTEEARKITVDPAIQQEISENNSAMQKIQNSINLATSAHNENIRISTRLDALKKEIGQLMSNICPTCTRPWDNAGELKQQKKTEFIELTGASEKNIVILKEVEPLHEHFSTMQTRNQDLQLKVSSAQASIAQAEQAEQIALQFLNQTHHQIKTHQAHMATLKEKENLLGATGQQMELTQYAKDLLGRNGFLGEIFDEVLLDIQNRTNEMIGMIPNVSRFVMSLSSSRLTKDGNKKKEIKATFFKNGNEIPFKALSGGQQVAVELCADLAVAEVIRERSGSKLGWIALDEAMDGLDIEPKKAALEVIKQKIKGQILIIDHATEIKEGFSTVFNVIFDGNYSRVDV